MHEQRDTDSRDNRDQQQLLLNRDNLHEFKSMHLEINLLHEELTVLRAKIEKYEKDRDSLLIWGVLALGAAVVAMGIFIFNSFMGLRK